MNLSKESVDTLVNVVQDALDNNLDSKSSVKNESLNKQLWNALHELWDMQESE